jgi:hypothetical protein
MRRKKDGHRQTNQHHVLGIYLQEILYNLGIFIGPHLPDHLKHSGDLNQTVQLWKHPVLNFSINECAFRNNIKPTEYPFQRENDHKISKQPGFYVPAPNFPNIVNHFPVLVFVRSKKSHNYVANDYMDHD